MQIITIDTPELGNRSYLIHDGQTAIIVDPSRRVAQFRAAAEEAHVTIAAICETHIHNDYVTGGFALSRKLSVPYYVSAHEDVQFEREPIDHEQSVKIGNLKITALASPGHTRHHLSYLVEHEGSAPALFSGGSLLYGAVGRTDLVSAADTKSLAEAQYRTAKFFVDRLPGSTELYPTHGFGSFCAATETEHLAVSTLAAQLKTNAVFIAKDQESFVTELLAGLDDYPAYYSKMGTANLSGPTEADLKQPESLTKEAVLSALHTGAAIIDLRSRKAYAGNHMKGTFNIELSNDLATYVGWLIAWDAPLIIVGTHSNDVSTAKEQLSLIGRDLIAGAITPASLLEGSETRTYAVRTFKDLEKTNNQCLIVDVRRKSEWDKSHIPSATNMPLHVLSDRMGSLSKDKEIWVHCMSGFRASIAASILDGAGYNVVLIDDNYANVASTNLIPTDKKSYVDDVAIGKAQLIDVRDMSEWKESHAAHAHHIQLGQILAEEFELEKDKPVYVYCATGDRSGMAAHSLQNLGYDATNIGGLVNWVSDGGEIES